jgi:uncharacterized protein
MGEVTTYPHGTFCWVDLGTTDVPGAKEFYGALLGWDFEDLPAGEDETYTMCRVDGKDVAGMHRHTEEEGVGWASSISVDDVDSATAKAQGLGGWVTVEPLDIPEAARLSVIRDPGGAVVTLWQPKGHIGARLVNEMGTWTWNELVTPDLAAAKAFYGELFGWTAREVPAPMPRAGFMLGELLVGGVHEPSGAERGAPSSWTVSFRVPDADEGAVRVEQLGGGIILPPSDIPVGGFAIVTDPSGAAFTIAAFPAGPFLGVDGS